MAAPPLGACRRPLRHAHTQACMLGWEGATCAGVLRGARSGILCICECTCPRRGRPTAFAFESRCATHHQAQPLPAACLTHRWEQCGLRQASQLHRRAPLARSCSMQTHALHVGKRTRPAPDPSPRPSPPQLSGWPYKGGPGPCGPSWAWEPPRAHRPPPPPASCACPCPGSSSDQGVCVTHCCVPQGGVQ